MTLLVNLMRFMSVAQSWTRRRQWQTERRKPSCCRLCTCMGSVRLNEKYAPECKCAPDWKCAPKFKVCTWLEMCTRICTHLNVQCAAISTRVHPKLCNGTHVRLWTQVCNHVQRNHHTPNHSKWSIMTVNSSHLDSVFSAGKFTAVFLLQLDCSVHHRSRE